MRKRLVVLAAPVATTPTLADCSSDIFSGSGGSGTSIDITVKDGKVTPSGDRVKTKVGTTVMLKIDADTSGEIHVHSTPEQEIEFDKGTAPRSSPSTSPGSWTWRTTHSSRSSCSSK